MSILIMLFNAWILEFAIAAPVGPIGLLCIRYSLTPGFKYGVAVGLGAALTDSFYGFLVGGGLTMTSSYIVAKSAYIRLLGGLLLLYLALKEFKSPPSINNESPLINKKTTTISLILTTFALTLANPMTIMSYLGVFSS